jgi:type VI secretion system protein ImpK
MNTTAQQANTSAISTRRGNLALALQEGFTVAARLRANRQQPTNDAAAFRAHVKSLLSGADRDARARGYDPDFVRLAIYAYVAFLDETVLNSSQPMFAAWTRQPLQEEVFGEHMAGENFFRYLSDLMSRQDSEDLADLLEVYLICLLLGFHGKYGANDPGSVQSIVMSVQQKIHRIRGPGTAGPAIWMLPQNEIVKKAADPWFRRLITGTAGAVVLAIVLWTAYYLLLRRQTSNIREVAQRIAPDATNVSR